MTDPTVNTDPTGSPSDPTPVAPSAPATRWAVELKVIVATAVSAVLGVLVTVLNDVQADPSLVGGLPTFWQSVITLVVPPLAVFLASYRASHTNR